MFSLLVYVLGEAKNLQARSHVSSIHRDVYCTLSLDQEEIFRTSTIEKSLRYSVVKYCVFKLLMTCLIAVHFLAKNFSLKCHDIFVSFQYMCSTVTGI